MACLAFNITPLQPSALAVGVATAAALTLSVQPMVEVSVVGTDPADLVVKQVTSAELAVEQVTPLALNIGEVCSVSGGDIVVLAVGEGPLRLSSGGYLLLDPDLNPPES